MKKRSTFILFTLLIIHFTSLPAEQKYYVRIADSEMKRNPESWMIDFAPALKWDYCNGLELQAIFNVWEKTGNKKYFDYVKTFADTVINQDGIINGYVADEFNIDKVDPGRMLILLYKVTKEEKLKKAIILLRNQMKSHPRTSEGGFWHKRIYPNQMWLDGIYMASPFLVEYADLFNEPQIYDDVVLQILTIAKHSYDPKTGLYYHGWDESRTQRWSDPQTGLSPNFWSRSIGWYMMALIDVLEFLPANHPQRSEIVRTLADLCRSVEKYRDSKTGMWYQVTDKGGKTGNYLESSGSAMFIYSWVKGAQKGYLSEEYLKKGEQAYFQFVKQFVKKNDDQTISITDGCSVAGLGGDPIYRDGSYEYYISEPKRDNDPKAVSPFMMVSVLLNK